MELDVDELDVTQVTKPWLKHVTPYHEIINLILTMISGMKL